VKVNEPHNDGYTPLWRAASWGHLDVIKWWILSGREMDLGKPGDFKTDVIGVAKKNGMTEVATLLERFKENSAQTRSGVAIEKFYDAACYGREPEAKKILEDNPNLNVNWKNEKEDGDTALYIACEKGFDAIVSLLLAHPAIDVNVKTKSGRTPFMIGCSNGYTSCVREMLKDQRINVNEPDNDGRTCSGKHEKVVALLLARPDVAVNEKNNDGYTLLMTACHANPPSVSIIESLILHPNIEPNESLPNGDTPFLVLCKANQTSAVVKFLREERVDINECDNQKRSPLWLATLSGFLYTVQLM